MSERREKILGPEAFYTVKEFLVGGLTGSDGLFRKIRRASKIEMFFAFWLLQSALILAGNYAITSRIEYVYSNYPPWLAPIDTWLAENTALTYAYINGAMIVSCSLLALLALKVALAKLIGGALGGDAEATSVSTAYSCSLIPDSLRILAVSAVHLLGLPSAIEMNYDLSGAGSTRYLARLGDLARETLAKAYELNVLTIALIGGAFLIWEAYLFYKMFSRVFDLERRRALLATILLATVFYAIMIKVPFALGTPRLYVDPMLFRMPAPVGLGPG